MNIARKYAALLLVLVLAVSLTACRKKVPPVARPTTPPPGGSSTSGRPPAPPEPVAEPTLMPAEPVASDDLGSKSLDDINRDSPLQPVYFDYDSSEINAQGQSALNANAELLKRFSTWIITIEGHCDERGTAEYNLALGERRALSAREYLVSLGVPPDRLRTVSYGKEFPFDPGHSESAWSKNRRAHFVITAR